MKEWSVGVALLVFLAGFAGAFIVGFGVEMLGRKEHTPPRTIGNIFHRELSRAAMIATVLTLLNYLWHRL